MRCCHHCKVRVKETKHFREKSEMARANDNCPFPDSFKEEKEGTELVVRLNEGCAHIMSGTNLILM